MYFTDFWHCFIENFIYICCLQRLEMRAKKFGVPLTDAAKKEARAARFGITADSNSSNNRSAASIKSSTVVSFVTICWNVVNHSSYKIYWYIFINRPFGSKREKIFFAGRLVWSTKKESRKVWYQRFKFIGKGNFKILWECFDLVQHLQLKIQKLRKNYLA